jgi:hypothetical protein
MFANAELAIQTGVAARAGRAGRRRRGRRSAQWAGRDRRGRPVGYIYVDGSSVGGTDEALLKDRRILRDEGFITCIVVIDAATGKIAAGPDITARGFAEDEQIFDQVIPKVEAPSSRPPRGGITDEHELQQVIRRTVGSWVGRQDPPPSDDHPDRHRGLTWRATGSGSGLLAAALAGAEPLYAVRWLDQADLRHRRRPGRRPCRGDRHRWRRHAAGRRGIAAAADRPGRGHRVGASSSGPRPFVVPSGRAEPGPDDVVVMSSNLQYGRCRRGCAHRAGSGVGRRRPRPAGGDSQRRRPAARRRVGGRCCPLSSGHPTCGALTGR